uniref:Uncharacterized protein n=1 Tax=Rhizophora mucronata TaxID=61149 RepID=A0A2P2NZ35_RHIMU
MLVKYSGFCVVFAYSLYLCS